MTLYEMTLIAARGMSDQHIDRRIAAMHAGPIGIDAMAVLRAFGEERERRSVYGGPPVQCPPTCPTCSG